MNYSVPYEYIKQKVDVRITETIIEVFYKGTRIASHPRRYGRTGQYETNIQHMPEKHKSYAKWNGDRFLNWAEDIGPDTKNVISYILKSKKIEQQAYKSCMAILTLSSKYSRHRLESACSLVLELTTKPSFKNIQIILQNNKDQQTQEDMPEESNETKKAGFTRGSSYYGGQ